jgi:hypothetical protein
MFRSLMGSSSGNHIKVTLHKTELVIHVHNKKMEKSQPVKNVGVCCVMDPGLQCFGDSLRIKGRIRPHGACLSAGTAVPLS